MHVFNIVGKVTRYLNNILGIILLLLLLFGMFIGFYYYYHTDKILKKDIPISSIQVINKINYIFEQADVAANYVATLWGKPCQQEEYNLKNLIALHNVVRSATIIHNGLIYCSSVYEISKNESSINLKAITENTITLLKADGVTPTSSIVGYNLYGGEWSSLIGINGSVFSDVLKEVEFKDAIFLAINNNWLDYNGRTSLIPDDLTNNNKMMIFGSDKYPYRIIVDTTKIDALNLSIDYLIIFMLLVVTGLVGIFFIVNIAPKQEFKNAILANELIPYYQLVVTTTDCKWRGLEVLARWQHPKKGIILPGQFIHLAEQSKLIIPMTKSLMVKVANELTEYIGLFPKPFFISFNISAAHLHDPTLLVDCQEFMASFPAKTINLVLEITEGQLIESTNRLDETLEKFHQLGVKISIDDFGTGYANFAYLQNIKVDHLKIDRTFIAMIYNSTEVNYLLDTIIDLAKHLELELVAEGVETVEQLYYLVTHGVNYIQGFLFSHPLPIHEMVQRLIKPCKVPMLSQQFSMFNDSFN